MLKYCYPAAMEKKKHSENSLHGSWRSGGRGWGIENDYSLISSVQYSKMMSF